MQFYTPLRYPGGKGKLAALMKKIFILNGFEDGTYIEPYAGGAGLALTLLIEEYARKIVINDIDHAVYAFWHTVLNETDFLLKQIHDTPVTMDKWHTQRAVHANLSDHSLAQIGFATFFLNRTNRSGILCGGVIGGKNQDGPYKIDSRFNKKNLSDRIKLIAKYRSRITVHKMDAFELIQQIKPNLSDKSLIYLDPPYFVKGRMLYKKFYNPDAHESIAKVLQDVKTPWIVTYDNVPEIRKIYEGEPSMEFSLVYSTHLSRDKGTEVMFYNNLSFPDNLGKKVGPIEITTVERAGGPWFSTP